MVLERLEQLGAVVLDRVQLEPGTFRDRAVGRLFAVQIEQRFPDLGMTSMLDQLREVLGRSGARRATGQQRPNRRIDRSRTGSENRFDGRELVGQGSTLGNHGGDR